MLHEVAHNDAFHHSRNFPREIGAYAGAAAFVMLDRADDAKRLFPSLMPAMLRP